MRANLQHVDQAGVISKAADDKSATSILNIPIFARSAISLAFVAFSSEESKVHCTVSLISNFEILFFSTPSSFTQRMYHNLVAIYERLEH